MGKNQRLKVHRQWLPGRSLCSIRSNRKWCKRRGSSLECQNCFFVYPIIDSNLKNLLNIHYFILFLVRTTPTINPINTKGKILIKIHSNPCKIVPATAKSRLLLSHDKYELFIKSNTIKMPINKMLIVIKMP